MDFYKGVFLGPVLVGKGDNSFFFKCDIAGFASGLLICIILKKNQQH